MKKYVIYEALVFIVILANALVIPNRPWPLFAIALINNFLFGMLWALIHKYVKPEEEKECLEKEKANKKKN